MPMSMPKMLRPRHEFPTPAFLAFLALLVAAAIAVAARLLL
jgi:hypothetical protein